MSDVKFKTCPFCGGEAYAKTNPSTLSAYVICENCNVVMEKNYKGEKRIEDILMELMAIDWNRRTNDGL